MPHKDSSNAHRHFLDFEEQCGIELANMRETSRELRSLYMEICNNGNSPTIRERAAAAHLTQSLYNGIENILKRTSKYCGVSLPKGEQWHSELARRFTKEQFAAFDLPQLIVPQIASSVAILRRFRHVVIHGYAMNLHWENMSHNVKLALEAIPIFDSTVTDYFKQEHQRINSPSS